MMTNHQNLGTLFLDKPNSDSKTCVHTKKKDQKKTKRICCTLKSNWELLDVLNIPQIEFDLPCKSSPLNAPFASHFCTSCRMINQNHWSPPKSSIFLWLIRGFLRKFEGNPKESNGSEPVFRFIEIQDFAMTCRQIHSCRWTNPSALHLRPVAPASGNLKLRELHFFSER